MPERPTAGLSSGKPKTSEEQFSSRSQGTGSTCSNTSLGNGSRWWEQALHLRGPPTAPTTPLWWTDAQCRHVAVSDLTDLRRADATLSHALLAANWIQSLLAKASNSAINLLREMVPLPTLWKSIRGNMKINFHPRSWSTASGLLVVSSNANFNALRNGPLRNLGTSL